MSAELRQVLSASDGERINVRQWLPRGRARHAFVAVHGVVSHSGWFAPLGERLSENGIALYATDRRGSGEAKNLKNVSETDVLLDDIRSVMAHAAQSSDKVSLFCWCFGATFGLALAPTLHSSEMGGGSLYLVAPSLVMAPVVIERMARAELSGGTLPVAFDPETEFSEMPSVCDWIRRDSLRLRRLPGYMPALNQDIYGRALRNIDFPGLRMRCVMAASDQIVNNEASLGVLKAKNVLTLPGGHAILLESADEIVKDILALS